MAIKGILDLLRVKQWIKNLLLFAPLFFSGKFFDIFLIQQVCIGFFIFSITSSCVYILNDIKDIEKDKMHYRKKKRPLPSGILSLQTAWVIFGVLTSFLIVSFFFLPIYFVLLCVLYLTNNILYTLWLKNIAIIDVSMIAIGFVIRLFAGGLMVAVSPSNWLVLMIYLVALLLGFAKRREDVLIKENSGEVLRGSISNYSISFIDAVLSFLSGVISLLYILYTIEANTFAGKYKEYLYLTSFFLVTGILRYLQLVFISEESDPTTLLYKDAILKVIVSLWLISITFLIYG